MCFGVWKLFDMLQKRNMIRFTNQNYGRQKNQIHERKLETQIRIEYKYTLAHINCETSIVLFLFCFHEFTLILFYSMNV